MKFTIYHNPRWGKSRGSVKILEDQGVQFDIINYITTPPSVPELKNISKKLNLRPKDFIRKGEKEFSDLSLDLYLENDTYLLEAMSNNPKLIERPIVIAGENAIIGRPPENILKLISI